MVDNLPAEGKVSIHRYYLPIVFFHILFPFFSRIWKRKIKRKMTKGKMSRENDKWPDDKVTEMTDESIRRKIRFTLSVIDRVVIFVISVICFQLKGSFSFSESGRNPSF